MMKLRVKDMDIATGGILIAILHKDDARKLDVHPGDRIILKKGARIVTCILDISESGKAVPPGKVGMFEEVLNKLGVKHNQEIEVSFSGKPESIRHIRDKLFGKELNYDEFLHIADDITNDRLTAIEMTYFVAGGFANGFSDEEVVQFTKAIVDSGDRLKFKGTILDKHCIGGIPGNRTTMIVVPIIAAAGFVIPKTSSRAITSPAGTADTMECLAKVELSEKKIKEIVRRIGACIVHGGSMNLAPADDKIIEIEHPLSIDAEGQLVASVMAKKYSVTSNYVLIDIPIGPNSKIKTRRDARNLKRKFKLVGKRLGMKVKVVFTDGSQPIGNAIGPLLESEDVMSVLRNDPLAPEDLKKKSLYLAGELLKMTGKYKFGSGYRLAKEILESGRALAKMKEIIKAQGPAKRRALGEHSYAIRSYADGKVRAIDNEIIAKVARIAGSPDDKGAGIYISRKVGERVRKGELLYTIYAESEAKLKLAQEFIQVQKNENKDSGYLIG
jgi:putative thymidine phosphorylase